MNKPRQPIVRFDKLKVRQLVITRISKAQKKLEIAIAKETVAFRTWRQEVLAFARTLAAKGSVLHDDEAFKKAVTSKYGQVCLENLKPPVLSVDTSVLGGAQNSVRKFERKLRALDAMPDGKAFRMSEEAFNHWLGDGGDE